MYKMYSQSQNRDMFSWKLIVLLNKTTLGEMKATRRELTNKKLASFRAVLAKKIIDYCHFFNNQNSCKKGDSCKFRHEDSPRCERDKDCADRICQFKHSETSEHRLVSEGGQKQQKPEYVECEVCRVMYIDTETSNNGCTRRSCQWKMNYGMTREEYLVRHGVPFSILS